MLIAIYSPTPGHGKSTVASCLVREGFENIPFAGPLRKMLRVFLREAGYDPIAITRMLYEHKDERIPELGVSPRHMMQTLGTEWGRGCIDPSVWTRIWRAQVRTALADGKSVVADDLRFAEEYEAVRTLGGRVWKVIRPDIDAVPVHASDGVLCERRFDRVITNNGTYEDLFRQVQYSLPQVQHLTP